VESVICSLAEVCSGCNQWGNPYQQQTQKKIESLQALLDLHDIQYTEKIELQSIAPFGFRDHFDFVIAEGKMGLYSHHQKDIIDLPDCLQLSPELKNFYHQFRKISWPIKKGSVRLRVSPKKEQGAWLDFANLDIQNLFSEEKTLLKLMELCSVEIGQRRKTLVKKDRLRLEDPTLKSWTRTWQNGKEIPLYSTIASFSQAGDRSNQVITHEIENLVAEISPKHILEYGAGNGNLTFSYLTEKRQVTIQETEPISIQGLKKTASEQRLEKNIQFTSNPQKTDLILANPPRSGLHRFLHDLEATKQPQHFIYMSCFPESFIDDAEILKKMNYQLKTIQIIDQFPQTNHYELISSWSL